MRRRSSTQKKKPARKKLKKKAPAKKKRAKKKPAPKTRTKKKAPVKKKKKSPSISTKEVSELLDQVHAEEKSEDRWEKMISLEPDDSEALNNVEEDLINKSNERSNKLRTWKYFSK